MQVRIELGGSVCAVDGGDRAAAKREVVAEREPATSDSGQPGTDLTHEDAEDAGDEVGLNCDEVAQRVA